MTRRASQCWQWKCSKCTPCRNLAQAPATKNLWVHRKLARICGFGLFIYTAATLLLIWAAFPGASRHLWHRATAAASPVLGPAPELPSTALKDAEDSIAAGSRSSTTFGGASGKNTSSPGNITAALVDALAPNPAVKDSNGVLNNTEATTALTETAATASADVPAEAPGFAAAGCPLHYPRMSVKELEDQRCYLFGGQPVRAPSSPAFL